MDAGEKLMGLKKAYADIILNTAKEAAARIMVSERKALRFEYELKNAKEEALQMLMRLKHIMDSKIREAEMASCTKQKKIEELEAQLQEAEDIVKDLREDLSAVQAELERFPKVKEVNLPEKVNGALEETIVFPPSEVQINLVPPFDTTNSNEDQRKKGEIFYNSLFPLKNSYIGNTDLPSIILRSKEIELYRNGFSQRIRACEQTLVDTKEIKPEPLASEDQESEKLHNAPSLMEEKQVHIDNSKKKLSPCKKNGILCPNQVKDTDQEAHGSSLTFSSSVKHINDMVVENFCDEITNIDTDSVKECNIQSTIKEELGSMRWETGEFSQDSKAMFDFPLVNSESKSNEVPIRSTNERVIKYTFQRKRKRGTLSSDGSGSNEKGNSLEAEKNDSVEESTREKKSVEQLIPFS